MPYIKKGYQFSAFQVGQVKAHLHHGLNAPQIQDIVVKADGKSHFSEQAIRDCIAKLEDDPFWTGQRQEGSARPRKTTAKQDKMIVDLLIKNRGKEKVTCPWLRKKLLFCRKLGKTALEERLHDAGLAYMRRRRKFKVGKKHIEGRVRYCERIKRTHQETLNQYAYSDGATFYGDRDDDEFESTQGAALGPMVWRLADGKDSLYADCVGPSSYQKGQGEPVRLWGLLTGGKVHMHVLDEGEHMDQTLYVELIEDFFAENMGHCTYLVQDYESCLRTPASLAALERSGIVLVEDFPVSSQDFNAIEGVWKILRDRLAATLPTQRETREAFIKRILAAVAWINRNRSDQLWKLATNQKERANDCLNSVPKGARTKW